jgi:hypothetical protein
VSQICQIKLNWGRVSRLDHHLSTTDCWFQNRDVQGLNAGEGWDTGVRRHTRSDQDGCNNAIKVAKNRNGASHHCEHPSDLPLDERENGSRLKSETDIAAYFAACMEGAADDPTFTAAPFLGRSRSRLDHGRVSRLPADRSWRTIEYMDQELVRVLDFIHNP